MIPAKRLLPRAKASFYTVENPLRGFPAKRCSLLQRTPFVPSARSSHVCKLRSIFCHVHAAAENNSIFSPLRRRTLRGLYSHQQGALQCEAPSFYVQSVNRTQAIVPFQFHTPLRLTQNPRISLFGLDFSLVIVSI